jgi:hypothetical protein
LAIDEQIDVFATLLLLKLMVKNGLIDGRRFLPRRPRRPGRPGRPGRAAAAGGGKNKPKQEEGTTHRCLLRFDGRASASSTKPPV